MFTRCWQRLLGGIHKFGHSADFAFVIDTGKNTFGLGQEQAGIGSYEFVRVLDFAGGNVCAGGFEIELFIVKSGSAIFDAQLSYYEKYARGFEVLVCQAIGAKQFGSAHLEIDGIDAVMNNAALVGFAVSRLDGYRARFNFCMVWKNSICFFISIHKLNKIYQD